MKKIFRAALILLTCLVTPQTPLLAQGNSAPPPVSERLEALTAERLDQARPASLVSPFYCVVSPVESELFITNVFSRPVTVSILVHDEQGEPFSLGTHTVQPTQPLRISLSEALAKAGETFEAGSVTLEYEGDVFMLEAWLVMSSGERFGEQFIEWPFHRMGEHAGREDGSFWDTRLLPTGVKPTYRVHNAGDRAVTYTLSLGQGHTVVHRERRTLAPNSVEAVSPLDFNSGLAHGWLHIEHEGEGGTLSAVGWLGFGPPGETPFLGLLSHHQHATGDPAEYYSTELPVGPARGRNASDLKVRRLPERPELPERSILSVYNPTGSSQSIDVGFLAPETGEELGRARRQLGGGEIVSLDLTELFHQESRSLPRQAGLDTIRIHLRTSTDALQLWAGNLSPTGHLSDLSLLAREDAHSNGLYALPSLAEAEVVDRLINVGDQPAHIYGQVFWDGGTYSLPVITIPSGHAYSLDIREIAERGEADVLGRTLDPDYTGGYLQWVTRRGSYEILDRLEIRRRGTVSRDVFGFRYNTCCPNDSIGDLVPGSLTWSGGSTLFEACEYIRTCSGLQGPYQASILSLTYSSPVSWNGVNISASNGSSQTVSFTAYGEEIINYPGDGCIPERQDIFDAGDVDSCEIFNPNGYDPDETCSGGTQPGVGSCGTCCLCCNQLYAEQVCKCESSGSCILQAQSAFNICRTSCATDFSCDDPNYCN